MAVITSNGATPATPADLRTEIVAIATGLAPGLTADLPGSLIEDMASTATGAAAIMDQAFVDLVNSISPTAANDALLLQLGNQQGIARGIGSNTSAYIVFSGPVGFVINVGFTVGDGTHQYTAQDPSVIQTGGSSAPVYCLAATAGTWAAPANTITQIVTSLPTGITVTCNNPAPALPGAAAQAIDDYRAQVIQAGQSVCTGSPTLIKTAIRKVAGVQARLVSFRRPASGGDQILVGGGDPYAVAAAIYSAGADFVNLVGRDSGGTTISTTINDYPDNYEITFVAPLLQAVAMVINWTTQSGTNFVDNAVVAAKVQPAIATYINSIFVGAPMSILELQAQFIAATNGALDPTKMESLTFAITIAGIPTAPSAGGILIFGNPEGYFYTTAPDIVVTNA